MPSAFFGWNRASSPWRFFAWRLASAPTPRSSICWMLCASHLAGAESRRNWWKLRSARISIAAPATSAAAAPTSRMPLGPVSNPSTGVFRPVRLVRAPLQHRRGRGSEIRRGLYASGDFFQTLGVSPAIGRLFSGADDHPGCGAPGAVLGYSYWQREYGGQPAAIGRKILLDGKPFEIIGVAQAGFFGVEVGRSFDVVVPVCAEPSLMVKTHTRPSGIIGGSP